MEERIDVKYFIVTEENGEQVRHKMNQLYTEGDIIAIAKTYKAMPNVTAVVIEKETTIVSKEYQHIEI